MTWEEELQRLDADLAAGRISAEEYRARRDAARGHRPGPGARPNPFPPAFSWADSRPQLRPVSSGGVPHQTPHQQAAPQQPPAHESPAPQPPAPEPPAHDPSAHDPSAHDPSAQHAAGESARVVPGQLARGSTERGSTERGSTERGSAEGGNAEADRTRIVSFSGPSGHVGRPGQAGQVNRPAQAGPVPNGWSGQPRTAAPQWRVRADQPPWGGAAGPPADYSWRRQGAEVFEDAGRRPERRKRAAWVLVPLVALLLIAAGTAYVLAPLRTGPQARPHPAPVPRAAPEPPAPANPPPAANPRPAPAPPPLAEPPAPKPAPASTAEVLVAPPPGPPSPLNGPLNPPDLQGSKATALPAPAHDLALQTGAVDGWFSGTDAVDPRTSLIAVRMPDQNAASGVVNAYLGAQQGLAPVDALSYKGVQVLSNGAGVFHTAYVSNNWAVVVEVNGHQVSAGDAFKPLLGQQLAQSPPPAR